MAHQGFSLILLDIMLPGIDGMELCQRFRRTLHRPIVSISSLDDEKTIVRALQLGGAIIWSSPSGPPCRRQRSTRTFGACATIFPLLSLMRKEATCG